MFTTEQFFDSLMLAIALGFMLGEVTALLRGLTKKKGGDR
jgi:hypothetical protein